MQFPRHYICIQFELEEVPRPFLPNGLGTRLLLHTQYDCMYLSLIKMSCVPPISSNDLGLSSGDDRQIATRHTHNAFGIARPLVVATPSTSLIRVKGEPVRVQSAYLYMSICQPHSQASNQVLTPELHLRNYMANMFSECQEDHTH